MTTHCVQVIAPVRTSSSEHCFETNTYFSPVVCFGWGGSRPYSMEKTCERHFRAEVLSMEPELGNLLSRIESVTCKIDQKGPRVPTIALGALKYMPIYPILHEGALEAATSAMRLCTRQAYTRATECLWKFPPRLLLPRCLISIDNSTNIP